MEYALLDIKGDKEVLGSFISLLGVALAHRNGGQHNIMDVQAFSSLVANDRIEAYGYIKENALYGIQVWDHGGAWTDARVGIQGLRLQYIHGECSDSDNISFLQWGIAQMKGKNPQKRTTVVGEPGDQLENILPKCGMRTRTRIYDC